MPLNRTPPPSHSQTGSPAPAATPTSTAPAFFATSLNSDLRTGSEPNLHYDFESEESAYVTQRNIKRKREGDNQLTSDYLNEDLRLFFEQMFGEWSRRQDAKNNIILKTVNEIKNQNSAITESLDFMSNKYDELLKKFTILEEEREKNRHYIKSLENRIEFLERNLRSSSIEIKNIPKSPRETKADMISVVQKIGKVIDEDINSLDICDVRRINTKTDNKPIILQLSSVLKKENIIRKLKQFNKNNKDNRLSTGHLDINAPLKPIYVSEHVSTETRRLYHACREFSKDNHFSFCWIAGGRVYLRKTEGLPAVRIDSTSDLSKLSSK